MGVRVRIRIRSRDKSLRLPALLNSGFESDEPDIAIPVNVAESLRLYPPPSDSEVEEISTAGGLAQVYTVRNAIAVALDLGERLGDEVPCNAVVNPFIDEVLLSDYVIDELGIEVISFRKGTWRHRSDPKGKIRESVTP